MGVRDSVPIREPLFARGLNDGRAAQNLTVQAICLVSQVLNVAIEIHLWPYGLRDRVLICFTPNKRTLQAPTHRDTDEFSRRPALYL